MMDTKELKQKFLKMIELIPEYKLIEDKQIFDILANIMVDTFREGLMSGLTTSSELIDAAKEAAEKAFPKKD